MKSVQIRIFLWSVFSRIWTEYGEIYLSVFSPNTVKYEPEKTQYLDTYHAMSLLVHAPLDVFYALQ